MVTQTLKNYLLIFYILCFIGVSVAQKDVDDACHHENSDTPGTCRLMDSCSSAMDDLIMNQIRPQICGYEDTTPIVCCPPKGTKSTTTTTTTTPTTTTTRATTKPTTTTQATTTKPRILKVGDKSIEQCKEYAKAVYVLKPSMTLMGGEQTYSKNDTCGIIATSLIVDGEDAKPREFPHMAHIGYEDENGFKVFQCGGSLISENFVLTAGHCLAIDNLGAAKYVKLGDLDTSTESDEAEVQIFTIEKIIPYPYYKPSSRYHDIGLLKLSKPAKFTAFVRPICLNTDEHFNKTNAVATGWGDTNWGRNTPSAHLQKVSLDVFTHEECKPKHQKSRKLKKGVINRIQLCAGSNIGRNDTCSVSILYLHHLGDSGGPLQVSHRTVYCMYSQIGVTSFGKACGNARTPAVYTRVSFYIKWIEKIVWP